MATSREARYSILSDSPSLDGPDPLDAEGAARRLEQMILASRESAPFTVSIEAGWGAGKSSLMRRMERRFQGRAEDQEGRPSADDVRTVWFNAWTAPEGQVLEGLIRSVLDKLDKNILRKVARQKKLLGGLRLGVTMAAGLLGFGNLVDQLWARASVDPKQRNELNDFVQQAMREWLERAPETKGRLIVVFIDDLDRCTPTTVMRVFEAMKLYLDAPGFVFVVGWDTEQVIRSVATARDAGHGVPHRYVEKIVQFGFRLRRPTSDQLTKLVEVFCNQAGLSSEVLDVAHRQLLIRTTDGNPRQLKRFINRFILLHELVEEESRAEILIMLLVLQSSYDSFYRLLSSTSGDEQDNPLVEFTAYVAARQAANRNDWAALASVLRARGSAVPPEVERSEVRGYFEGYERELPADYQGLATEQQFLDLLELMEPEDKQQIWNLARSYTLPPPTITATPDAAPATPEATDFVAAPGTTVLWIDDEPKPEDQAVLPAGVILVVATSQAEAERILAGSRRIDLIISDIGRGEDRAAGLDGLHELREHGYDGPALFFTMSPTAGHLEVAQNLRAEVLSTHPELSQAVRRLLPPASPPPAAAPVPA